MVLPQRIGVARVGHALHHAGGDATDDLPNRARGKIRVLSDQRHPAVVAERHHDGRARKATVREVEHAGLASALDDGLVGVREGIHLVGLDAVALVRNGDNEHHGDGDDGDGDENLTVHFCLFL